MSQVTTTPIFYLLILRLSHLKICFFFEFDILKSPLKIACADGFVEAKTLYWGLLKGPLAGKDVLDGFYEEGKISLKSFFFSFFLTEWETTLNCHGERRVVLNFFLKHFFLCIIYLPGFRGKKYFFSRNSPTR